MASYAAPSSSESGIAAREITESSKGRVAWTAANVLTDTPLALGIRGQVRIDELVRTVAHVFSNRANFL